MEVNEFELKSGYYVHFRIINLRNVMNTLILLSYALNCIITVFLHEGLWHYLTHYGEYAIKQRNQTKPYRSK